MTSINIADRVDRVAALYTQTWVLNEEEVCSILYMLEPNSKILYFNLIYSDRQYSKTCSLDY